FISTFIGEHLAWHAERLAAGENMTLSRRDFIQVATTIGASLAWSGTGCRSRTSWRERRDLYPEGVASGDPDPHSVILWTRRPFAEGTRQLLTVEVADDEAFSRIIAQTEAPVSSATDWTARVLVDRKSTRLNSSHLGI